MGFVGGILFPLSAVLMTLAVWAYQGTGGSFTGALVAIGIFVATNLVGFGSLKNEVQGMQRTMATKTDIANLELRLSEKFQTKEACRDLHNVVKAKTHGASH